VPLPTDTSMIRTLSDPAMELEAVRGKRVQVTIRNKWPAIPKRRWLELAPHTLTIYKRKTSKRPHRVFILRSEHVSVTTPEARVKVQFELPSFVVQGIIEQRKEFNDKIYPHPLYVHGDKTWELAVLQAASGGASMKQPDMLTNNSQRQSHKVRDPRQAPAKAHAAASASVRGDAFVVRAGAIAKFPSHICEKILFQGVEHLKNYPIDRGETFSGIAASRDVQLLAQEFLTNLQVCRQCCTNWYLYVVAPRT